MAGIPADALPRLQTWWARVEADTQAIFEAMYMEAPALVSRAVSGGAWLADGPEPGLAAQLGTDSDAAQAAADQIPRLDSAAPEITPYHAQVGQHVTIKWTEQNVSQAPLGAYFTDVYVTDPSEAQVSGARLEGAGLPLAAASSEPGTSPAGRPRVSTR